MVVTATGDAFFLGVLLGLAAADVMVGGTAVVAALGVLGRWGSSSLVALAGAQAVLGPAGWTGSFAAVLSSWGGAVALVLVAPPRLVPAVAFGLAAAELIAGPALGSGTVLAPLALRVVVSAIAVAAAWVCGHRLARDIARPAGLAIAVAAAVLAFIA